MSTMNGSRSGIAFGLLLAVAMAAQAQLPPEIMADRHLLEAEGMLAKDDHAGALEAMNKIVALQEAHSLTVPDAFHYKYAEIAFAAGDFGAAVDAVNTYLATAGREGEFYREALALLVEAEPARTARQEELRRQETRQQAARQWVQEWESNMVVIPAGRYSRTSCTGFSRCSGKDQPIHQVVIANAFAVSKYEVTFNQWHQCVAAGGCNYRPDDEGWGRGGRPVINVSWSDAQEFVGWLSSVTGMPYRLLSEAEWEYAARAGSTTKYSWGNRIGTNLANCDGCGSQWDNRQTAPAGSFAANAFGLHDMHGNVWEWTEDCWNRNYSDAPSDGSAWRSGDCAKRVLRGGSWSNLTRHLHSAYRFGVATGYRQDDFGFRVARAVTE